MKKKLIYGGISVAVLIAAFDFTARLINAKPVPRKNNTMHNTMFVKASKVVPVEIEANMNYRGRVA